ncbi:MAG: EF-hand domain-containing protein [Clostridia bacterium]|nr:EF-hand domain-containing protein [Clostridia bacterium]
MDQLKKQFEKDLKTKLLYKTSGHMTEEILLLKNFKYFDEDNTNKCDAATFFQVISKVGVLNLSEEQLNQLFDLYSNGQRYLNYKDFIGEVFNNESLKNKKGNQIEKEQVQNIEQNENENEEEMDPIDELILKIRNRLSKRGLRNLIRMEGRFRELDENNEQELDLKSFGQICHEFDLGLNDDEIEELFVSFDKEERGMVNYDDFIRILRGELNDKRKELVQNVFKHLDIDNKGELTVEELLNLYNPRQSLECVEQRKSEEEAMSIFEESLRGNHKYLNGDEGDTKPVDIEEFEDFYESVSIMIPSDELFRDIVLRTWGLIKDEPKEEENEEEPQEREDVHERLPPKNEEYEEDYREYPKERREDMEPQEQEREEEYEERYEPPVNKGKEKDKEKEFRKNILNEENLDIFRDKLGARGIVVVMNFANLLRQYDRRGDKNISLNDFSDIISASKVIMSDDEIYELYNDFADKKTNLLNYEDFLKSLLSNLNPRRQNIVNEAFKKLDIEKGGVIDLSDIKENFNSKNCPLVRAAMMSEEAFFNGFMETFQTHHNLFRSAKIKKVNFEEFEDYYKYVSITVDDDYLFEETVISSWKLSKSATAHAGPKDNIKEIIANPELAIPNNEEAFKANYRSSKKCFPQKNKIVPYGVDDKVTDYSNELHPKGELVGIKLNKNDDCLSYFKKKVVARGLRGIMSLRRTFMLFDENKNNKLKRKEFHKFLDDYRFNIPADIEQKLFDTFDLNKSGNIDYNEFIHVLIGKMNDFRTQIVERVFEQLDKEKRGRVPYDVIRESYNADKHPEVLDGKRTKQEVISRFIDLFEYHFNLLNSNKKSDSASLEEFIDFYSYISIFIDNDKYFENLMARVWGLGNPKNYGKIIKFVKYKSPYY